MTNAHNNANEEGIIRNRLRQIVNGEGVDAYMNDEHLIEELHNSNSRGVRFYEIPLTPERQRVRDRNERYLAGDSVWQDRRTPTVTIQVTTNTPHRVPSLGETMRNANERLQRIRIASEEMNERARLDARQRSERRERRRETEEQRLQREEREREREQRLAEECAQREARHNERIEEMMRLVRECSPNHSLLFSRVIDTVEHLRLACEISDPCYSCAFSYLDYGLVNIIKIVNPLLHTQLISTYNRGNPTFRTNQMIMESGIVNHFDREVSDIIFDFASLIQMIYTETSRDRQTHTLPLFAHVDEHNNLTFNGDHICTLSRTYDFEDGLIYLKQLRNDNIDRAVFENEKRIFKALNDECWYALLNILRNKYRLFNSIPKIAPKIRRTNSVERIDQLIKLEDGRPEEDYLPTVIRYERPPFVRDGRDITIERPKISLRAKTVEDKTILTHPIVHHRVDIPSGHGMRIDYRDHNIEEYHDNYLPYLVYRPINIGRYISNNNVEYNLSEDDGDYRY